MERRRNVSVLHVKQSDDGSFTFSQFQYCQTSKFLCQFLYVIINFYGLQCSILLNQISIFHYVYCLIFAHLDDNKAIISTFNV